MTVTRATQPPRGIYLFISLSLLSLSFSESVLFEITENVSFTELTGVKEHGNCNWTNFFLSFSLSFSFSFSFVWFVFFLHAVEVGDCEKVVWGFY